MLPSRGDCRFVVTIVVCVVSQFIHRVAVAFCRGDNAFERHDYPAAIAYYEQARALGLARTEGLSWKLTQALVVTGHLAEHR